MTSQIYAEVIGDPIDHSLSPVIHRFWLDALGIDADYRRRQVTRADLPAYIEERRKDGDWRGANVTMPLKLDAAALADEATDRAVAAGAANVLMMREGRLVAANTDVGAIAALLARLHQAKAAMGSVTLLGNGGAARAALVALKLVGLRAVRIQARDMAQAMKLAVEFGLEAEPAPLTAPIVSDGLINATPLVVAAREHSLAVLTGLDMLVEQAATSFTLFFGAEPPRDLDAELWHKLGR
jgi:shikimate dehydrogenase